MKIPETDSIRELAEFWDTHDLSQFSDQLEEVRELVFGRRTSNSVSVPLDAEERRLIREMATSRGVEEAVLIREWVREKLHH